DLVPTMTDVGVEGLWTDMNEPADFATDTHTVPDHVLADGGGQPTTMMEAHNVYGSTMAQATREGLEKARPDERPFVLTRAGYAGVQREAAVWTGDSPSTWDALGQTVPMLLNMGLSGVSFAGSDVGGWNGALWAGGISADLFVRWNAVGSISPFFRNHTQKQAERQEPWVFGPEAETIARDQITARYAWMPYWYTLFEEAVRTGAPMLRPLLWAFQQDENTWNLGDQAMVGPWMMVAPVLTPGAVHRDVYLPEGRWFEEGSGAVYEGPGWESLWVSRPSLPTLIREGAILPRREPELWEGQAPMDRLFLDLYPSASETTFSLYEDDGHSMDYKDGVYLRTPYTLQGTETGATFTVGVREGSWTPEDRDLILRVRRVDHGATAVRRDGVDIPQVDTLEELLQEGEGWWYDAHDLSLMVATPDGAETTVVLSKKDDEHNPQMPRPLAAGFPNVEEPREGTEAAVGGMRQP
ncbi:MAG: TIM-barrel domain-containing protein, partial [Myxococcota bacterium]|nr:TIM-barrel domain-containing protein [Myxococcota bacterium]